MVYRYSIMVSSALIINWLILVDLAVFSTEISAFLLVISHVVGEVKTFLSALTFLLLTFGSSMPIFCAAENIPDVAGKYDSMPKAIVSLFAITLGWFEADDVMSVRGSHSLFLFILFLFGGLSVILLLNLLVAQLNRAYEYIYKDMLGFARLNRANLIVDGVSKCSQAKWEKFLEALALDQKIEFDPGDVGIAGGIAVKESAMIHTGLTEQIQRFGGSTSPDSPWPAEKEDEGAEERFDRLEQLMMKAVKRMNHTRKKQQRQSSTADSKDRSGTGTGSLSKDDDSLQSGSSLGLDK